MDLATILGLVFGLAVVFVVMVMDGGSPAELFSNPSAILLIFGGSLAATAITVSVQMVTKIPMLLGLSARDKKENILESIELMVTMADQARRDGLLSLEDAAKKIEDPFLKKGIMMVVDGVDAHQVRAILETNVEQMQARHRKAYGMFAAAGGFSPTFGIIGTVMGLISVLKELDNPDKLAKSIASAFLATLWGLLSANLIYLPIAAKLKSKSEEEAHVRYMQLEGILAIHAGENPRIVKEKLIAFLPPSESRKLDDNAEAQPEKKPGARGAQKAEA